MELAFWGFLIGFSFSLASCELKPMNTKHLKWNAMTLTALGASVVGAVFGAAQDNAYVLLLSGVLLGLVFGVNLVAAAQRRAVSA